MEAPILFDPNVHAHLIALMASLHAMCITEPTHVIATFLPPLNHDVMIKWWADRVSEVSAGERQIIIQIAENEEGKQEVAGLVALGMPHSETGPFRGYVEKLLVSPRYRQKGIARKLMVLLEDVAVKEGRKLLILDTEKGSPAEFMYPKWGYVRVGEIPGDMISPVDGSLKTGVFFYKDLRLVEKLS